MIASLLRHSRTRDFYLDFEDASKHRHPPINTLWASSALPSRHGNCIFFRSFPTRIDKTGDEEGGAVTCMRQALIEQPSRRCRADSNNGPSIAPDQSGCFIPLRGSPGRISWWILIFGRIFGVYVVVSSPTAPEDDASNPRRGGMATGDNLAPSARSPLLLSLSFCLDSLFYHF